MGGLRTTIDTYIVCNEGTVAHYAHFFFGCLVPLIERDMASEAQKCYRICTYVGSMARVLERVFPKRIAGYAEADPGGGMSDKQRLFDAFLSLKQNSSVGTELLDAYDVFGCANFMYLQKSKDWNSNSDSALASLEARYIARHTAGAGHWSAADKKRYKHLGITDKARRLLAVRPRVCAFFAAAAPPRPAPDILLVERRVEGAGIAASNRDNFSGQRRSIFNHAALRAALEATYGARVRNVCLDDMDIFEQYRLFASARVVVGQHGAGLCNIFFMDPARAPALVEVCPDWNCGNYWFENLAALCGVRYKSVPQPRMTAAEWRAFAPGASMDGPGAKAATGAPPGRRIAPLLKNERAIKTAGDKRMLEHPEATFAMNSGSVNVGAVLAAVEKSMSH